MKFQSEGCINILIELILAIKLEFKFIPLLPCFLSVVSSLPTLHNIVLVWFLHTNTHTPVWLTDYLSVSQFIVSFMMYMNQVQYPCPFLIWFGYLRIQNCSVQTLHWIRCYNTSMRILFYFAWICGNVPFSQSLSHNLYK